MVYCVLSKVFIFLEGITYYWEFQCAEAVMVIAVVIIW